MFNRFRFLGAFKRNGMMKNRDIVKLTTDTTGKMIYNMVSHLSNQAATSFSTLLFSGYTSLYKYFTTPTPPTPLLLKGPKYRKTKQYSANITAALELSETPKRELKTSIPNKIIHPEAPSTIFNVANSIATFFTYWNPKPQVKTIQSVKPAIKKPTKKSLKNSPMNDSVEAKMIALVTKFNELKDPLDQDYKEAERILLEQIDLVEYEIMEHAQRRVDLYFYMLVAVYNAHAFVEKKTTNKQHGVGSTKRGTNACHDSLFPHIKLSYPKPKPFTLWSFEITPPTIRATPPTILGTHFEDSNNMTTELPKIVNVFDTYLELASPGHQSAPSRYLKSLLKDLNEVSQGTITPVDGMNRFLITMKDFFSDFEKSLNDKKNDKKFDYPNVMKKIWKLQYSGTLLSQKFESKTIDMATIIQQASKSKKTEVDMQYVCSLLFVSPKQYTYYSINPSALLQHYAEIQKEIYDTPSTVAESKRLKK